MADGSAGIVNVDSKATTNESPSRSTAAQPSIVTEPRPALIPPDSSLVVAVKSAANWQSETVTVNVSSSNNGGLPLSVARRLDIRLDLVLLTASSGTAPIHDRVYFLVVGRLRA